MAFDVNPDPTMPPLAMGAGVAATYADLIPLAELKGADPTNYGPDARVMFLRVAMSQPFNEHPMIRLLAWWTGRAQPSIIDAQIADVTLSSASQAKVPITDSEPFPGVGTPLTFAYAVDKTPYDINGIAPDGVYFLKIVISDDIPRDWKLGISNTGSSDHIYTWVVAETPGETEQSWIDVNPDNLDFVPGGKNVIIGTGVTPLEVIAGNRGTGVLQITSTTVIPLALGQFSLVETLPISILPGGTRPLHIDYSPSATPGVHAVTLNFESNDPSRGVGASSTAEHNRAVDLLGKTARLELALALDSSGSMRWAPDGAFNPAVGDSRWEKLEAAVDILLKLLRDHVGNGGRFGIVQFPDPTNSELAIDWLPTVSGSPILPITAPTGMNETQRAQADLASVSPSGWTPMGQAMELALGPPTDTAARYFDNNAVDKDLNERWLILISDGANNRGLRDPDDYLAPHFSNKAVRVITVGYGSVGSFEVNIPLLENIAARSGGEFKNANSFNNDLDGIRMALLKSVASSLQLQGVVDPSGVLTESSPQAIVPIDVDPSCVKISFVVNWGTRDPSGNAVKVELIRPDLTVVTASAAVIGSGIANYRRDTFEMFTFDRSYLSNLANPANPHFGRWKIVISASQLFRDDSEPYEYFVYAQSSLKLSSESPRGPVADGDSLRFAADLKMIAEPDLKADVRLNVFAPKLSANDWLASKNVSASELESARQNLQQDDVNELQLKALALKEKGHEFPGDTTGSQYTMVESETPGEYTVEIPPALVEGLYSFVITAQGSTREGIAFTRENSGDFYVSATQNCYTKIVHAFWLILRRVCGWLRV